MERAKREEEGMVKIGEITHYGFLVVGFFFLLFGGGISRFFNLFLASFIFSAVLKGIIRKKRVNLIFMLGVDAALWLNVLGSLYLFGEWLYYDKILHLLIPSLFTAGIYDYFDKNLKIDKKMIFLVCVGGLALFEIYEFFIDLLFHLDLQGVFSSTGRMVVGRLEDTMSDLIVGSLGSVSFLVCTRNHGEKGV